jgi:tetratricopeptide (TPR) repeat protein
MAKKPEQPVDAASWIVHGNEHYQHDEYRRALECYNRAVRLNPDSAAAQYGRGIALYALERYRGALTAYNSALKLAACFATCSPRRIWAYEPSCCPQGPQRRESPVISGGTGEVGSAKRNCHRALDGEVAWPGTFSRLLEVWHEGLAATAMPPAGAPGLGRVCEGAG